MIWTNRMFLARLPRVREAEQRLRIYDTELHKQLHWQLHKNAANNLEQVLAATPYKTPTVRPPASYHENYSS